ncbi:LCP family protein [Holdemanella porci]|uniref:LCP family protein n=1 Tax=Holdemanella porci TaxID=2652276 RepID=UPI003F92A4D8
MSKNPNQRSLGFTIFAIVLSIVLVATAGIMVYEILKLEILPSNILMPVILVIILFSLILLLLINFCAHGLATKIIFSFLVILISVAYGLGDYYLYSTASTLNTVTEQAAKSKNTVSLIVMAESTKEDVQDINGSKIGVLTNINKEGTKKSLNDISKQNIGYSTEKFDNVPAMLQALYEGQVDAIILNEAYRSNVSEIENYENFNNETKVIHQTVYYTKEANNSLAVSDITSKPFTILITGNDSFGALDEVSRSDVNMIVTINPLTSTILMTSIPRDAFVTEVCDDYACNYGVEDKLTHTGIYGADTTKDTLENLLDIDINYIFRVNFSSMIDIVDALGGIDIDVAEGMAVSRFYSDSTLEGVHEGQNHLNGKRALAYSRERKAYLDGDVQRARNQQQVLQAMFKKASSPEIITKYSNILKVVGKAFDTNMTTKEITSFIKYQLQASPSWKFEQYVLKGENTLKVSPELGMEVSAVELYAYSIQTASEKIQAVLDGKSSDTIETEEDIPAGTLSEEQIEAQIQQGLYEAQYYGEETPEEMK